MIEIEDLFDEALLTYDDNITALSLHISYLSAKSLNKKDKSTSKTKQHFSSIENELLQRKNLESYRIYFVRVLDSFNDEIELFIKLSKMDLSGYSDIIYNILDIITHNSDVIEKMDILKNFQLEITDINFYSEKILDKLK